MNARVQCFWCNRQVWMDEAKYFNHDDVYGYECEPCGQKNKEEIAMLYQSFLARCEKYKTNPQKQEKPITFLP